MKVIFNTINTIQMTVFMLYNPRNVRIKLIDIILFNSVQTVLRSENKMLQMLSIT